MGKQGKMVVVGVMVLAMGVGGVGSMMGGPPARSAGRGPVDVEAIEILPLADESMTARFGVELAAQLALPNPEMHFDAIVAREQLAIRALPEEIEPEQQAGFVRGVADNRGRVPQFIEQIHARMRSGDRLKHLGSAERDGHFVTRFRLAVTEGGVDFYDLLIGVRRGQPIIVDYYSLTSGQWQSELMAELFRVALLEHQLDGDDGRRIGALGEAMRSGQYEEALRLYDVLPEAAKGLRLMWARRIEAAASTDNLERYLSILDEYAIQFPNDPAVHARLLDAHFEREQWMDASADVDALDASFPDVFWDGTRAAIAMKRGAHTSALALAEGLIRSDPTVIDGPDVALAASLALGDLEGAARFATSLRDDFGVDLAVLAAQPGYESVAELPAPQPAMDPAQP